MISPTFAVSHNSILGPIPSSMEKMDSLDVLVLRNNRLNGSLPVSLGNLKELQTVYISDNKLEGEVSHFHFSNLTRLSSFYASNKSSIALRVSSNWISPLQPLYLELRSCLIELYSFIPKQ
ncbi:hypothetical protein M5689_020140 [Euphorbia peplus]|nr:hypothetical protein M5689_020140 [Euphorbia peplus]